MEQEHERSAAKTSSKLKPAIVVIEAEDESPVAEEEAKGRHEANLSAVQSRQGTQVSDF